jgi:large subunit ribosomal protein L14
MKALKANVGKAIPTECILNVCDNSGAKLIKMYGVRGGKTVRGRKVSAGVGDIINAAVKSGKPEMKKQVVLAIIVRQKKEYRRPDGTRIKFEDNSAVVLKDEKGNPKGTIFKGPIAKEACDRWPMLAKVARIIV